MQNLFKNTVKTILTLFTLIAVIILIFYLWFGFQERPMPLQGYVLNKINSNAAPFELRPDAISLKFSKEANFLNIKIKQPKVYKNDEEVVSLPNLYIKTNPIAILRNRGINLHFDFQDINNLGAIATNSKAGKDNIDFEKLFSMLAKNQALSRSFTLNLTNIKVSEGMSFDLLGIKLVEIGDRSAMLKSYFSSNALGLDSEIETLVKFDEQKTLRVEFKSNSFYLKSKGIASNAMLKSKDFAFQGFVALQPKDFRVLDSEINLHGDINLSYNDSTYKIRDINALGKLDAKNFATQFENLKLNINDVEVEGSLLIDSKHIDLSFSTSSQNYKNALNLLPSNFISTTQEWLRTSVRTGNVSADCKLTYIFAEKNWDYEISIPFSEASLKFTKKLPQVENGKGSILAQPQQIKIEVEDASFLDVNGITANGEIKIPQKISNKKSDTDKLQELAAEEVEEPDSSTAGENSEIVSEMQQKLGVESGDSAILDLKITTSSDRLRDMIAVLNAFSGDSKIEKIDAKGTANTSAHIILPLTDTKNLMNNIDIKVDSSIAFSEFDAAYDKNLSNLELDVSYDNENNEIEASGTILYDNSIPLNLLYNKELIPNFEFNLNDVQILFNNDISKLNKLFNVPPALSGRLSAKIEFASEDTMSISSELDGLKIDAPQFFLNKASDSLGSFNMQVKKEGDIVKLFDINFEVPPIIIKGNLTINSNNDISGKLFYNHIDIGHMEISYTNDLLNFTSQKLDFRKQNIFKIIVGKSATNPRNYGGKIGAAFLKNEISLKDISISNKFCPDCKLELAAKLMPNNTNFNLVKRGQNILLNSNDAGSVLKGFDIFEKVSGGVLNVKLDEDGNGGTSGEITIDNFDVVQNNFFIKLFSLPSLTVSPQTVKEVMEGGALKFDTLICPVNINGSQIKFRKCIAKGQTINIKLSGVIDLDTNTVKMEGIFIPKNILNSIVKEIPLIGKVLSGGNNEGVIATSFKIEGSLNEPQIIINPLSTLTPGFTRELLNVFN